MKEFMQTITPLVFFKKCLCLAGVATLVAASSTVALAQQKFVAVTSIMEHPALDAARDGIKLELEEAGYVEGKNLRWQYQTAQGNVGTAAQIARKFVGDQPDVIVAIGTPSAQTMLAATKTTPVVYSVITDPIGAKLVKDWAPSGTNVTGVSNIIDIGQQIDLILEVVPQTKKIGVIYNPSEANSAYYIKQLEELLPAKDITMIKVAAPRTIDVGTAAQNLIGKVDVIYSIADHNVMAAYEAVVKVANEHKIPLIASDPSCGVRGAAVSFGVDFFEVGRQTGRQVIRILNGEKPGDIASEKGTKFELIVNKNAAEKQNVQIPQELLSKATRIID